MFADVSQVSSLAADAGYRKRSVINHESVRTLLHQAAIREEEMAEFSMEDFGSCSSSDSSSEADTPASADTQGRPTGTSAGKGSAMSLDVLQVMQSAISL